MRSVKDARAIRNGGVSDRGTWILEAGATGPRRCAWLHHATPPVPTAEGGRPASHCRSEALRLKAAAHGVEAGPARLQRRRRNALRKLQQRRWRIVFA